MKKYTFILAALFSMPAMAAVDIAPSATTADCDSGVLKTTSGSANLEANWDANTINLNWYAGSDSDTPLTVQTGAQTCTYDGNITLPATQPTKPGYTFDHWIVRQLFDLSTLNTSTKGDWYTSKNFAGDFCYSYIKNTGDEIVSNDCAENEFDGLSTGEWRTEFSYGTVKGTAYCSAKSGNNHSYNWGGNSADWTASESELTSASGESELCWCKVTGFDAEKDGSYVGVVSPSWVFNYDYDGSASDCARLCAAGCADNVRYYSAFRAALYGVTQ